MKKGITEEQKKQIRQLRQGGLSYGHIGKVFGISRQRVHQILSGYNGYELVRPKNKLYPLIRQFIFERDGNQCVKCGTPKNLILHHIDGDDLHNIGNNLVTLCTSCHLNYHRPSLTPTHSPHILQKPYLTPKRRQGVIKKKQQWISKYEQRIKILRREIRDLL